MATRTASTINRAARAQTRPSATIATSHECCPMTTLVVVLGLVAVAGVPYFLWSRVEAYKHRRATIIHQDTLSLGDDIVPASIHPEVALDECIGSGACVRACPEKDI